MQGLLKFRTPDVVGSHKTPRTVSQKLFKQLGTFSEELFLKFGFTGIFIIEGIHISIFREVLALAQIGHPVTESQPCTPLVLLERRRFCDRDIFVKSP
jgi:hypothetical protein